MIAENKGETTMNFKNGMTCPVCEIGTVTEENKDITFEYKGKKRTISNQVVYECPECGESFQNNHDQILTDKLLMDSRREIDSLLTSQEIRSIRNQFGLTQVDFAKLLQVGEKNFARYESCHATQSRMTDNLLRVLREYPQAIKVFGGLFQTKENTIGNLYTMRVRTAGEKTSPVKVHIIPSDSNDEQGVCHACNGF